MSHVSSDRAADLSAGQLATGVRLAEQHAGLREQGVHQRDGGWVVAREALAPCLGPPSAEPGDGDEADASWWRPSLRSGGGTTSSSLRPRGCCSRPGTRLPR